MFGGTLNPTLLLLLVPHSIQGLIDGADLSFKQAVGFESIFLTAHNVLLSSKLQSIQYSLTCDCCLQAGSHSVILLN